MNATFRNLLALLALMLVFSGDSSAAVKTWTANEQVINADLNANFNEINTAATALVTDAKVAASAAIQHSKLATPGLMPKAWAYVAGPCSANPCTVTENSGVTAVNWTAAGIYTVTLTTSPANANFAIFITPRLNDVTDHVFCQVTGQDNLAPHVVFKCFDDTDAAENTGFYVMILDS